MIAQLVLILLPTAVLLFARYRCRVTMAEITAGEVAIIAALNGALVVAGYHYIKNASMTDTEFWNGRIVDKQKNRQSCCHSYTVCTGTGKTTVCTTHYRHSHDWSWDLALSTGDVVHTKRCSRGAPPPLWTSAQVGDPATVERTYQNYLRAGKGSLYQSSSGPVDLPPYPSVHTLYRANKALNLGVGGITMGSWDAALAELNAELNMDQHLDVNVMVVFTPHSPSIVPALESHWGGVRQNDAVFVFGVDKDLKIEWAEGMVVPGTNERLKTEIRHRLPGIPVKDLYPEIASLVKHHWRWEGVDHLRYLASQAKPTWGGILFLTLVSVLLNGFLWHIALTNDVRDWRRS